jgi:hypothetical protein
MNKQQSGRVAAGLALILLGGVLYVLERNAGLDAAALFFLIGGAFLAGYLYRREFGLLIPAGVLLGLGTGTIVEQSRFNYGQPILWGLGLGFIFIYVIELIYERKGRWWPLIPGAVLVLLGLPRVGSVIDFLFANWPLVLVLAGVLILIGGLRRSSG